MGEKPRPCGRKEGELGAEEYSEVEDLEAGGD